MHANSDFALCIRKPASCSRHANCARAQMGSRNPQRQEFFAPTLTGDACRYFFDFGPLRALANAGGGIADTLAAPGNLGPTSTANAPQCAPSSGDEVATLREAVEGPGAASTFGAADSLQERSDNQPTATNATPSAATIHSPVEDSGVCTAGVGPSSAPAYLSTPDRSRLARLRRILRP